MVAPEVEDAARRAMQIYEQRLRTQLEKTHWDSFLAIEPDSGDYYLGRTLEEAIGAAQAARPGRLVYAMRIGHEVAVEIGSRPL